MSMPTLEDILRDQIEEQKREIASLKEQLTETNDSYGEQIDIANDYLERLKVYKDAEEQWLLHKIPCKVGDTVYEISDLVVKEYVVKNGSGIRMEVDERHDYNPRLINFMSDSIGKTVFSTREAAEQALGERTPS